LPTFGKATKSRSSSGRERQEKSITQQRREVENLAKEHGYKIVREYDDQGISGWKRGDDRPGFQRMIQDARNKRDFQAVLCDDLDRVSRSEVMTAFSDLSGLAPGDERGS
jgi:site-specific DNA recombinase